jgi:hypothetical protein
MISVAFAAAGEGAVVCIILFSIEGAQQALPPDHPEAPAQFLLTFGDRIGRTLSIVG